MTCVVCSDADGVARGCEHCPAVGVALDTEAVARQAVALLVLAGGDLSVLAPRELSALAAVLVILGDEGQVAT